MIRSQKTTRALLPDPGKLRIVGGGQVERFEIVVEAEDVTGVTQDHCGFGFVKRPGRAHANMVLPLGQKNRNGWLFTDVDDARELPVFESKWGQLVPAVAGDGAAVAEVRRSWYF